MTAIIVSIAILLVQIPPPYPRILPRITIQKLKLKAGLQSTSVQFNAQNKPQLAESSG